MTTSMLAGIGAGLISLSALLNIVAWVLGESGVTAFYSCLAAFFAILLWRECRKGEW